MPVILTPPDATHELLQRRTLRCKEFALANGKRRIIAKLGRVHYHRDDGLLDDIETAAEVEAGTGEIIANRLPYRFRLRTAGIGFDYQSRADGGIVRVALTRVGNNPINQNQTFTFTRNNNRIRFADVATDLDIVFVIGRGGIKTYRVLKSASAAKTWRWAIEYDTNGQNKITDTIRGIDNFNETARGTRPLQREVNVSVSDSAPVLQGSGRMRFLRDETWTGETKAFDQITHVPAWVNEAIYPVVIDPDITENIVADADDGHEKRNTGAWQSNATLVNIGKYNYYYDPAFRFQGIAIAPGTTIDLAVLKLNAISSTVGGGAGNLYGYDVDDAAVLSATVKPSTMAKTTASTAVPASTSTGIRSYTVTSIVAEIVARGGWASGNDITIFGIGTTGGYQRTRFEDYSNGGTDEAQLEIDVAGGGGGQPYRRRLGGIQFAGWQPGSAIRRW
jgi:hypothetical protein